jgi:hypothetical protein
MGRTARASIRWHFERVLALRHERAAAVRNPAANRVTPGLHGPPLRTPPGDRARRKSSDTSRAAAAATAAGDTSRARRRRRGPAQIE